MAVVVAAVATPLTAASGPAAAEPAGSAGVWDLLAECESGGRWHLNTGNGYYGGLQFSRATWAARGGERYAYYPHRASKAEQIAIAVRLRDARGGYGAWPACARSLGLPL